MASKKDREIESLKWQLGVSRRDAQVAWGHIRARDEREREKRAADARAKAREVRKQHLTDVGNGILKLKDASNARVTQENGGRVRLQAEFDLDAEEHALVQRALHGPQREPERPKAYQINFQALENTRAAIRYATAQRFVTGIRF
ncbi:hypothetical protein J2Y69_003083 [Microbacterium resistens]|uniref:Uncharacterized protein n=1 Tax=Microbacterium resistens TaxID=156977 RepID=A0ABU1SFT2_9MICO|nr:hypothetical protein [Microbacterium resistens]MDR6868467.1 hypothetical protein [Microbacterium resistens]